MKRVRLGSILASAVVSVGAIAALTAPAAHADKIPEKQIKSECADAGGTYTTTVQGGTRFSTCTYKDNEGNKFRDYYADGGYYSTRPF
jgi:hypothetical protein